MNGLTRRHFAGGVAGLALWAGAVRAKDSVLPVPASLRDAAHEAAAQGEPLVLLVSLPGCPYCEVVRRYYLLPLRGQGLHAWQIDVTDRQRIVRDFSHKPSTGAALARRWQAGYTPSVLFFDIRGQEIAERLVGIAVPDFYGAYLDQALDKARRKLARST